MNKPLVERIDALRWRITNQRDLSELDSILADVRELVEAASVFDFPQDESRADDDIFACGFGVAEMRRLSAILRKVGGDIGTEPSPAAVEVQNPASNPLSPGEYFRCDECHEPAGTRQVCRSCVRLEIESDDAVEAQTSAVKVPDEVMEALSDLFHLAKASAAEVHRSHDHIQEDNAIIARAELAIQSLTQTTETPR